MLGFFPIELHSSWTGSGSAMKFPKPPPLPYGASDQGAEALARDWVLHLGQHDAEVTQFSKDGGIDVHSSEWVVQVKNYVGSVGVKEVRELSGVAATDGRKPVLFTSGTLTQEAEEFARTAEVAVFRYSPEAGELEALGEAAEALLAASSNEGTSFAVPLQSYSRPSFEAHMAFYKDARRWTYTHPGLLERPLLDRDPLEMSEPQQSDSPSVLDWKFRGTLKAVVSNASYLGIERRGSDFAGLDELMVFLEINRLSYNSRLDTDKPAESSESSDLASDQRICLELLYLMDEILGEMQEPRVTGAPDYKTVEKQVMEVINVYDGFYESASAGKAEVSYGRALLQEVIATCRAIVSREGWKLEVFEESLEGLLAGASSSLR